MYLRLLTIVLLRFQVNARTNDQLMIVDYLEDKKSITVNQPVQK